MDQINVLYVAHDASLYGSNQSLFYLIKELCGRYHISPLVLVPREGEFTEKLGEENIKYLVVRYSLWQAVYKSRLRFVVKTIIRRTRNIIAWRKIRRIIQNHKIDLVHSNSSVVEMGAECAAYLDVPHVWHIREFGKEDWGMHYMYNRKYVHEKYNAAAVLIAISKGIEEKYRREYPKCAIYTIYNGIPFEKFPIRKKQNINMINFCQVGYISEAKNSIQVLEACRILKKENNINFVVNFIGDGDRIYYKRFLKYIEEYGLQPYIKLWGFRENVEEILPQMDAGIISSRMEGFGRVTVEYMLSGLPVIGYAAGGTLELIDNGETGFLYRTVEELAYYMSYILQNRNKAEMMGKNGRAQAEMKFTADKNADSVYKVYQNVLEEN